MSAKWSEYPESEVSDTSVFETALMDLLPGERFSLLVVCINESIDVLLQFADGSEGRAGERLPLQDREPTLHLIEPGCSCRREESAPWVSREPSFVLLVGIEIVQDDVKFAVREGGDKAVHEARELDAAPAFRMRGDHLAGGHFECGKQGRSAVPPVVVALAEGVS